MNRVSISVLMSIYKEPIEWLRQSIDSILNQSFSEIELIVICDNPMHKEGINLLKDYCRKDKRVVVIYNDTNIGLTKSLNKGLKISHGKYIARMDADDISDSQRLEIQFEFMEGHPDVSVCGTGIRVLNDNKLTKKTYNLYTECDDIKSVFVLRSAFTHPTVMFRRAIIDNGYSYDESFVCAQDYDLWERLLEDSCIFANIDLPLLNYRMSAIQVSKNKRNIQVANARRIRNRYLTSIGICLKEDELDLLVLPFRRNVPVNKKMVADYIDLLYRIQCEMERNPWFNLLAYNTEAIRFSINLALISSNRITCLWKILKSPMMSFHVLKNNINYYCHRL